MSQIKFSGFPMPPTVNGLYITIGKRRVKSGGYRAFEREALKWQMLNIHFVLQARALVAEILRMGQVIEVQHTFYFPTKDILTKDGRPKKNDTSNRIKALDDVLGKLLHVDDSHFWSGTYNKFAIPDLAEAHVQVALSARKL